MTACILARCCFRLPLVEQILPHSPQVVLPLCMCSWSRRAFLVLNSLPQMSHWGLVAVAVARSSAKIPPGSSSSGANFLRVSSAPPEGNSFRGDDVDEREAEQERNMIMTFFLNALRRNQLIFF